MTAVGGAQGLGLTAPDAPLRVLVVDDDEVDRMIVRRGLARGGVTASVDEVATAPEALARVASERYDCVFLDYNIPGGDGLTLLRGIRRAGLDVPVVMLTGQGDEQVAVELMKAGAVDYLSKASLTPERLAQSLRYGVELARTSAFARQAEAERRESAERTRFLAEASAAMFGSLDVEAVLERVARLSVPFVADYCLAYLVAPDGEPVGIASAHSDPEKQRWADLIATHYRPSRDNPTGPISTSMATGTSVHIEHISAEIVERAATTAELREAFRALGPRTGLFVPLTARNRQLGALAFVRVGTRRGFDPAERTLGEELGQRAAIALDNARLYELAELSRADAEGARAEAEAARAEAEDANRAKSQFLARMSHDLRTPLNAIGGYAQLIELGVHGPVTEAQAAAIARIRRAQEHLLTLIQDILNFARLEAGQVSITLEAIAVRDLFDELAALVRPEAASRGLALEVDDGAASLVVRADRARTMQVLINLTSNALKFTERGSVRISAARSGERVALRVSDTGRGIPRDRLQAIFDPFVQVAGIADEKKGGVGLGLAIGRELARLMGGDLTVESEVGAGSTFTLTLPAAPA